MIRTKTITAVGPCRNCKTFVPRSPCRSGLPRFSVQLLLRPHFLDAHRRYVEILMTRALDLKAFPRKRGVLRRFAGVVLLNIDSLKREFAILAVLLKLEKPTEQVA